MDKRERSHIFFNRLESALAFKKMTKSELARQVRADRSTIGQLLSPRGARLPNGQLVAEIASALEVSTDWLLGLANRPERPGDLIASAIALTPAERSSADTQILDWHLETNGSKIRHVPATLPDVLKTDAMIDWEYASFDDDHVKTAIEATQNQLEFLESGVSDYEIALPIHEITTCVEGVGYYGTISQKHRKEQLELIAQKCDALYPRLRVFLFDAQKTYSAPITVFGFNLAVIYVGRFYLAFREGQRIRALTDHFDGLVRDAIIDARDTADYISSLKNKM